MRKRVGSSRVVWGAILSSAMAIGLFLTTNPLAAQAPGPGDPQFSGPKPVVAGSPEVIPQVEGTAPLVLEVQIRGLQMTQLHEAQKYLRTRKDREFDPQQLQNDVRKLLSSGLFADVKTYTKPAPGGIIVVFEVVERPRVRYVRFLGNRGLSDQQLLKESNLKVGDAINTFATEEARRKVEDMYHQKGYPKAEVSIIEGDQQADKGVALLINEGSLERIASVSFVGNEIATDARLRTQIQSKPGFLYYFFGGKIDRSKILQDVEKLTLYYRNLGYFKAKVGYDMKFNTAGNWADLQFIIDEGPRYIVRNVSIEGAENFDGNEIAKFLKLKDGEHFHQAKMAADVATIVDVYGSQGYVFADIVPERRFLEEPGVLDMVYKVKEGKVFSVGKVNVHIAGEFPHTRETVILNRLSLTPGTIIDSRKLRADERRLKASQLFETNPQQGEPPKIVVRPPEFDAELAALERESAVRGQSPEDVRPMVRATAPIQPPQPRATSSIYSWDGPQPVGR